MSAEIAAQGLKIFDTPPDHVDLIRRERVGVFDQIKQLIDNYTIFVSECDDTPRFTVAPVQQLSVAGNFRLSGCD